MTAGKKCDIVSISDKGRALNRVKVITMRYIDLNGVSSIKEQSDVMTRTLCGLSGYDIVKIRSSVYCMTVKAIRRLARNVIHANRAMKTPYTIRHAYTVLDEYRADDVLIVNYIRGNIYVQNMRGLIMDYVDEMLMNDRRLI